MVVFAHLLAVEVEWLMLVPVVVSVVLGVVVLVATVTVIFLTEIATATAVTELTIVCNLNQIDFHHY